MKNFGIYPLIFLLATVSVLFAFRYQPQQTVTSTYLAESDASTDCENDFDALTCANTGEIDIGGRAQINMKIFYTYSAGTIVNMQCDVKDSNIGDFWFLPMKCVGEVCKPDIQRYTVSASRQFNYNFGVIADKIRCKFWVTSGNSGDKIKAYLRWGSIVRSR